MEHIEAVVKLLKTSTHLISSHDKFDLLNSISVSEFHHCDLFKVTKKLFNPMRPGFKLPSTSESALDRCNVSIWSQFNSELRL